MLRGGVHGSWVVSVQLGWGTRAESRTHPHRGMVLALELQASHSDEWDEVGGRELRPEAQGLGQAGRPAVSAAGRGWACLCRPEPASDALMFSHQLVISERVEEGAL